METNVGELLERHRAFWRRDKVDRPLITVEPWVPLAAGTTPLPTLDGTILQGDQEIRPEMLDARTFAEWQKPPQGPLITGDTFAVRTALMRVPWVEAILGCPIFLDEASGSAWSQAFLSDPRDIQRLALKPDNPWLGKLRELTQTLVDSSDGSYLVGHTLMRGPIDMVRAVLGDNEMCLAILDSPDAVRDLLEATTDVFVEVGRAQTAIIPPFHGGYCSPFGIWAPGTVVRTQCDMSALLSAATYAEMVIPFENKVCRPFDYSVIHLHSGFLHTVDALLESEFPTAIEIALDTGSTPVIAREVIDIGRKILQRKPLLLEGWMTLADVEYALESLPAAGLWLHARLEPDDLARWQTSGGRVAAV